MGDGNRILEKDQEILQDVKWGPDLPLCEKAMNLKVWVPLTQARPAKTKKAASAKRPGRN